MIKKAKRMKYMCYLPLIYYKPVVDYCIMDITIHNNYMNTQMYPNNMNNYFILTSINSLCINQTFRTSCLLFSIIIR